MGLMPIPQPYSVGIFLTYKCSGACRHCLYACSPHWSADWLSLEDAELILRQLARTLPRPLIPGRIGVNEGLHFSGGEPFLNFDRLLQLTELARKLGIPAIFVETNGFWCTDDDTTRARLAALKEAGMDGILISANPFILERVPFERTERAARIAREIFDGNVIVYQAFFYEQFKRLGLKGTLSFDDYVRMAGSSLQYVELFASGRAPYKLAHLYRHYPASRFFGLSCRQELIRDWHVHVDNYGNFVPGYCGGLSLGDARDLPTLCRGIDLERMPVLQALLTGLRALYELGLEFGYQEREGYVSRCHLCVDIRRHLALTSEFPELKPRAFYERLED
ncbi:MAG: radical SAM protein [Anaerolineae bacterium]|nr:radical SAM protein [Anaerolineae bacterium]